MHPTTGSVEPLICLNPFWLVLRLRAPARGGGMGPASPHVQPQCPVEALPYLRIRFRTNRRNPNSRRVIYKKSRPNTKRNFISLYRKTKCPSSLNRSSGSSYLPNGAKKMRASSSTRRRRFFLNISKCHPVSVPFRHCPFLPPLPSENEHYSSSSLPSAIENLSLDQFGSNIQFFTT